MNELPLRDIHLPDAVSWWPLAIGWWVLIALLIIVMAYFFYYLKNKKDKPKPKANYKKAALNEIQQLKKNHNSNDDNDIELLRQVSQLIRKISLSYLPRQQVASLTGQNWISQLNTINPQNKIPETISQLLIDAPYQAHAEFEKTQLLNHCEDWIKHLPHISHVDSGDTQ